MLKKAVVGALMAFVAVNMADAAVISVHGAFQATGWEVYYGSPSAPIDPLFLDYSATFDDSLLYDADSSVLTINSTNIPYPITFSFTGSTIVLATTGNSNGCAHSPSTFCAFIPASTGIAYFVEQSPAGGGGWAASTITSTAVVPEPLTWTMMVAGFGLAGAALRRRRRAMVAA